MMFKANTIIYRQLKSFVRYSSVVTVLVYYLYILLKESCLSPVRFGGADSAVFATIGYSWLEGLIPYKDLFDHKGPLLYLINAAGFVLCGDELGILILQICFAFLWIVLALWMFSKNWLFGCVSLFFWGRTIFFPSFEGGNLTEEYAILFNVISVACYCSSVGTPKIRFFVYGLMGGAAFLLRQNLAIVSFVLFVFELIDVRKNGQTIVNIVSCGLGFLVVCLPFIGYFYSKNALPVFLDSYIIFNLKYSSTNIGGANVFELISSKIARYWSSFIMLFIFTFTPLIFGRIVLVAKSLLMLLVTIITAYMSGKGYGHYHLALVPACLYVSYNFIDCMNVYAGGGASLTFCGAMRTVSAKVSNRIKVVFCFIIIVVLVIFNINTLKCSVKYLSSDTRERVVAELYEMGLSPGCSILNLGNHQGSKVFTIFRAVPDQRIFFPATLNPYKGGVNDIYNNIDAVVSNGTYEFILSKTILNLDEYQIVGNAFRNYVYKRVR